MVKVPLFAAKHQLTHFHLIYIYEYQQCVHYNITLLQFLQEVHINQVLIVT